MHHFSFKIEVKWSRYSTMDFKCKYFLCSDHYWSHPNGWMSQFFLNSSWIGLANFLPIYCCQGTEPNVRKESGPPFFISISIKNLSKRWSWNVYKWLSISDLNHQLPPLILETDSELRMRIFKEWPVSSYRGFRYMAWTAPAPWLVTASLFWPLIGHKASHHPRPASLGGWGLVSQESNIRFMPQQQISMTLNFHHASSILASTMHLPFWLFYCSLLFILIWT